MQMSDLMFDIVAQDRTRNAFDSVGRSAANTNTRIDSLSRSSNQAMRGMQANVSNLAAQFQDIGVQLAGGQSPFLIAMQQGTQISAVLGNAGAAGAVRMLGGAFASLLSPVSLATIAVVGLGGAAIQYFTTLLTEGDKSAEVLREQNELIGQVAKTWGDAVPALQAYVDQLARVQEQSDLLQATDIVANQQWDLARQQVEAVNVEIADLVTQLQQAGASQETILALQDAWNAASEAVRNNSADTETLTAVQEALAAALSETGIPAVDSMAAAVSGLSETLAGAARQAAIFRDQAIQALTLGKGGPALGSLSPLWSEGGKFMTNEQFQPFGNAPIPTPRGTPELSGYPYEKMNRARSGGRSEAEKQAEAYEKVVQSLQDELEMVGKSTTEQRALQLQRRADVDATSAQGQAIAGLVEQIDREKEAYKTAKEAGDYMRNALKDSFMSLIPQIETGNAALDSFINKMIQASAEALFFGTGPFAGGSGGGGGLIGSLLSGFGFGGPRAVGGAVDPYTDYMVGESGPEIVRIGARGGQVSSARASGAGVNVNFQVHNNSKAEVRTERRETANGTTIEMFIDEVVSEKLSTPGSQSRSALQSGYGLKSGLARR